MLLVITGVPREVSVYLHFKTSLCEAGSVKAEIKHFIGSVNK